MIEIPSGDLATYFARSRMSNYVVSTAQVGVMASLMEQLSMSSSDFDDLVTTEKNSEVNELNAEGIDTQIIYPIGRLSEEELERVLRDNTPGERMKGFERPTTN
jgi:predicted nucleotidyltransferase